MLERPHPREAQLVERQMILKRKDRKNKQRHDQVGRQHMEGAALPRHRLACDLAVDQEIDGIVDRIEEFVDLAFRPMTIWAM
jgi:hypothetical protein